MKRFISIFMVVAIVCSFFLLACPASAAGTGEHALRGQFVVSNVAYNVDISYTGYAVFSVFLSPLFMYFYMYLSDQPIYFEPAVNSSDGEGYSLVSDGNLTLYWDVIDSFDLITFSSLFSSENPSFFINPNSFLVYSLNTTLPSDLRLLNFKVKTACSPDDILVVLDSLRGQISVSTVVSALAFVAGVSVGLVFMWWGLRKAADALMRAFKRGRVDL